MDRGFDQRDVADFGDVLGRAAADPSLRASSIVPTKENDALLQALLQISFESPLDPGRVLDFLCLGFEHGQVHTRHPRYFGLLHTAPSEIASMAAALVAVFNPQLATRSHAPFAVDLEEHLVRALAHRFGYARENVEGTFTNGGAEANATALFLALSRAFPEWETRGVRAFSRDPKIYVSAEAHPTMARAARLAGLGTDAVRTIPVDATHRMKVSTLRETIANDRASNGTPLLIVATAGTTNSGAIDPLLDVASIAERASAWFHVDAAWGGLLALVPEQSRHLEGIARADSIAFDPHKTLSVPLGCGMFLTRRPGSLAKAFHDRAGYMPRKADRDPYARSMAWSRRFIGAPLFAELASLGWTGVAERLRTQLAMGELLKTRLREANFQVVNETPLPVACFVDRTRKGGDRGAFLGAVMREVVGSNAGWLSVTRLSNGAKVLRACVTNIHTDERDVERLVQALERARHIDASCKDSPA